MKCLIVKKKWADLILSGEKTGEMRSLRRNMRGTIGIIESGTGTIIGECRLHACSDMSHMTADELYRMYLSNHCVNDVTALRRWNKAWHIDRAFRYEKPIPYKHPKGAVIWINV